MTELFVRISRYFSSHRTAFWLSMAAVFVFFGYFAAQIHLEEDINKLMPSSKNEDGTTKLAFADLKIKDKTFLLFEWQGPSQGDEMVMALTEACDSFISVLQQRDSVSQTIDDVFYRLPDGLEVTEGDIVAVEGQPGHDVQPWEDGLQVGLQADAILDEHDHRILLDDLN